jgi:murein DD-endopeptidase MepM/ murein hydrolase activator NlpD
LPFDASLAAPVPTRRSSRTSATLLQVTPETPGAGRATARRQAAGSAPERTAVVWDRPVEKKPTDAAATPAAPSSATPTLDIPASQPAAEASAVSSTAAPASTATPPQPVTRRARRLRTGEFPAVAEPTIAPVGPAEPERPAAAFEAELPMRDEPAPLLDAVLEPAVADEAVATSSTMPVDEPASNATPSGTGSAWIADTFAKILAAQAAAAVASTAKVVDTRDPRLTEAQSTTAAAQVASAQTATAPSSAKTDAASQPAPQPSIADRPVAEPTASQVREDRPRTERIEPLTGPIPQPAASGVDEFEAAARLFAFTGETPVQSAAAEAEPATEADVEAEAEAETESAKHAAPRRSQARRGASFKRVATASFSVGVFGIVGLMAVGMTTPAEAVAAVNGTDASLSVVAPGDTAQVMDEAAIQAYVAPGDAQNDTLQRTENYTTTTTAQLASEAGIQNFSNLFHNNPNSNIQWPFAVGVTMSYGFGMRSGRMHEGIDFTPGSGAPVQAIAEGTVRVASEAGGPYGVHVIVDHIVDGELVSSHSAHMQYGSLQVTPGQHVTVGTVLGRTGNTGRSFGAHTHFEILQNGTTAIDPWPWLQEHTDGTHAVG